MSTDEKRKEKPKKGANITMIMPTRNRLHLVEAHLFFLSRLGFLGHIIVADGSDEPIAQRLSEYVDRIKPGFTISFAHTPKREGEGAWTNINSCIEKSLTLVDTPYACLCFDDDFILPRFLQDAVSILEDEKSVGFVVGRQYLLTLESNKQTWFRPFSGIEIGGVREISDLNAGSRMENFFGRPFQLAYAVVRRETILNYVPRDYRSYRVADLSSDLNWYCAIVSSGTGRFLKAAQVVRLRHSSNTKTYGQNSTEMLSLLLNGGVVGDASRLAGRLETLMSQHIKLKNIDTVPRESFATSVLIITAWALRNVQITNVFQGKFQIRLNYLIHFKRRLAFIWFAAFNFGKLVFLRRAIAKSRFPGVNRP
jgi:glycosyltransferase domain-containing protein